MIFKIQDLNKNLKENNFFLFHGVNNGHKEEVLEKLFKQIYRDNIFKYFEKEIFANIENFYSKILSRSFFEKNKLIIIKDGTDKLKNEIEILKDKNLEDVKIVILSGILDKKSKLRNFFEKDKNLISVAFYSDNNQTLSTITKAFFLEKKISISQESINLIINRANGERGNLLNNLEKIKNYLIDKKSISVEEIYSLTNLIENYSINELVDNCLAKNKQRTVFILNENNFSFEDSIIIIRTFLIKSKRLLKLTQNFYDNKSLDKTILDFKPPIFWKDKEVIKQQIKNWSLEKTYKLIDEINRVELSIKKNSYNSLNILSDFILNTSKN